jgi:hypothetical protein
MAKVAIIAAASIVFCKTLILDILATKGLEATEFALMAPTTTPRLRAVTATLAPARARAMARPMPRPAPVTMATCPHRYCLGRQCLARSAG